MCYYIIIISMIFFKGLCLICFLSGISVEVEAPECCQSVLMLGQGIGNIVRNGLFTLQPWGHFQE